MSETKNRPWYEEFADGGEAGEEQESAGGASEFARLLEGSAGGKAKKLKVGDRIRGEILVAGKEEVFVSTGTQNDGMVHRRELLDAEGNFPYKTGDVVELYVTQVKGTEISLSPKKTSKNMADDLEDAYQRRVPVDGRISEVCKGGVRVNVMGKSAFCPISQIDLRHVEQPEEYVGKRFEFLITQFSEGGRNIVVSRRRLLESQKGENEGSFVQEHREGSIIPGRITRLEKFGAFVEVAPGVEGLVHISELGWSRVADPSEVVSVGQEVMVKVLGHENREGRLKISLSIKQAGAEPWENISALVQEGQVVPGKVTRCMKFGAFVEVAPGIEGLVPMSEMSYTKRVMRSDELFKEGERILVMVKEIDKGAKRILLSLKDAGTDPWALVPRKFPVGAIIPGKVERREPYGLFIRLDDGVTGLLPRSKAMENPEFPFEKLKPGEEVMIQVAELRQEERRISLQVPKDPGSDDWKKHVAKDAGTGSLGTLGDQFKNFFEKKNKA